MRYLTLGALACLLMATPAYAQATDPAVLTPITAFMTAFNKGDVAGGGDPCGVADLVIVDEWRPRVARAEVRSTPGWPISAQQTPARRRRQKSPSRADPRRGEAAPTPT